MPLSAPDGTTHSQLTLDGAVPEAHLKIVIIVMNC